MADLGIAYQLIGPDGTRAVIGNSTDAAADPDFCAYLDKDGIVGLLDGADVRESATDIVEGDGGTHGPFYLGRRPGVINVVFPPGGEPETLDALQAKLDRATLALRADTLLRWTPRGESIERELRLRRQIKPQWPGDIVRRGQLSMVSADPVIVSSSETSLVLTPDQAAGELGVQDPITDPLTSELNVTAQQYCVNQGLVPTWPRFRIDGPITNPQIVNQTIGQTVALTYTLSAGEWLDVYPQRGVILLGGTADRYAAYDPDLSEWWQLQDGSNDVRLFASAYSAGAQVTVYWRHAWSV